MREEFLITRQGKQYVLFQGLLDEAHTQGLHGIDTDLVQVPTPENGNVAIVKAVCEMEDGRKFSGIGDASPENVGRNIAPHIIRMAETRAKARALRDAVNVGATALEELSEGDDAPPAGNYQSQRGQRGSGGSAAPTPISRSRGSTQRNQRSDDGGADGEAQAAPRPSARASAPEADEASNGQAEKPAASSQAKRGGRGERQAGAKARKSQVDLLKTLAVEWAGEGGVERLEKRIEKPLADLTRSEADEWIDRLTPEGRE